MTERINVLKKEIWNNINIIFHSRDIRKCQNGFEVLFDLDVKKRFFQGVNDNGVNLTFDVLKKNIFQLNGKVYGMKIFPKEQGK